MKRIDSLEVRHFAITIQFLTFAMMLYVVLATPGIDVLHASVTPIHQVVSRTGEQMP